MRDEEGTLILRDKDPVRWDRYRAMRQQIEERDSNFDALLDRNCAKDVFSDAGLKNLRTLVDCLDEGAASHQLALTLISMATYSKESRALAAKRSIAYLVSTGKWPPYMPAKVTQTAKKIAEFYDRRHGTYQSCDMKKQVRLFTKELNKVRIWVSSLKVPISGIRSVRYFHHPGLDKSVVIFGEAHGTLRAGMQRVVPAFENLLRDMKPAKIDFMIEARDWSTLTLNPLLSDNEITQMNEARIWIMRCVHAHDPEVCPENVRFSWLDPYAHSKISKLIHKDGRPSKEVTRKQWSGYVRHRVKNEKDLRRYLLGSSEGRDRTDYAAEESIGDGPERLKKECDKTLPVLKKRWIEFAMEHFRTLENARYAHDWSKDEYLNLQAYLMQRYAMDVFTICRIMKDNANADGFRRFYIIYEGAWHAKNQTKMLEDLGFRLLLKEDLSKRKTDSVAT